MNTTTKGTWEIHSGNPARPLTEESDDEAHSLADADALWNGPQRAREHSSESELDWTLQVALVEGSISRARARAKSILAHTFSRPNRSRKPALSIINRGWVCGPLKTRCLLCVCNLSQRSSKALRPVASIAKTFLIRKIKTSGSCLSRLRALSNLSAAPKKKEPNIR